ncbi:MAG: hypothetical protein DCC55_28345 [Chloroflexi bacterium]|nr:MAG: hypothetical protein DCC55_28345 [Chloroflexota bacterium]
MRIAAVEKLGYYPTPAHTLSLIAQALTVPAHTNSPVRLLDPCAGKGEALAHITHHLRQQNANVRSYGIELADARAPIAAQALDHLLQADYRDVNMSQFGWGLLYLNPPYDFEAGNVGAAKNRQEYTFLRNTFNRLQNGGVLAYLAPIQLLAQEKVCRVLAANFDRLSVWRLPDDEFDQFDQIVIFGIARDKPEPNEEMQRLLHSYSLENLPPSLADFDLPPYPIPASPVPDDKLIFRRLSLSYEKVIAVAAAKGAHSTPLWRDWTKPATEDGFRPVVPLRTGHVASLISSGQMGTVHLGTLVAKGRCVKDTVYLDASGNEVEPDDPTMKSSKERFITQVHTLSAQGEHAIIESVPDMESFLADHGAAIAQAIAGKYQPLYSEPTAEEWAHVSRLMRHKRLPGRSEGGLLPAQKHVAIAAVRSLKAQGWTDVIGEQGTGKTCTSLAALDLANAYPAIVLCPSHMTEKWAREARDVIPGVHAQVINSLTDLQAFVERYRPGDKAVAVLSKEKAKLGPGWKVSVMWRPRRIVVERDYYGRALATAVVKLPACPTCGAFVCDKEGVPQRNAPAKPVKCSECNQPLYEFHGFRRWPISDYIKRRLRGFFKTSICDEFHQFKGASTDQAESYHHLVLSTKYTLNLTGTLFGGKSTDLFSLRYRIDPNVRKDYAFDDAQRWAEHYGRLERTFNRNDEDLDYGAYNAKQRYVVNTKEIPGVSPAIFGRLLNSCIFVRITDLGYALPAYKEVITRIDMSKGQARQYNKLNDTLYSVIAQGMGWSVDPADRQKARAMLSVWLQTCLSRPNACFRSETVHWTIGGERVPFTTRPDDRETMRLAQMDIGLNDEGEAPFVLHPINREQPKEQELIRLAQSEIRQGRKIILGVRQTGTRDIQPHLQSILAQAGIRAVILPDSLPPAKREAWIDARVHDIDVLITNPRKVETGLDLIKFATIICYEVEYSLYTLWQFMRRVWRLGQTKPAKVIFLVYQHTLEESALALIGEKMKAALLLYGDNAASAITADADAGEGSLLNELASRILNGEQLTADGITGLLTPIAATSESATPIAPEPEILPESEPEILPEPEPVITKPVHRQASAQPDPVPMHVQLSLWQALLEPPATEEKPAPKVYKQQASGQLSFLDLVAA